MKEKLFNQKGYVKNYVSGAVKMLMAGLFVLFEFYLVVVLSLWLHGYVLAIYYLIDIVAVFIVIGLVNKNTNSSFKVTWLVIIATLPIVGLIMYALWGRDLRTRKLRDRHLNLLNGPAVLLKKDNELFEEFSVRFPYRAKQAKFIENEGFPLALSSQPQYFSSGEEAFEAVLRDIDHATKFIFVDFFIVAEGILWKRVRKSLLECRKRGVEIRFLYDDFGAMLRTDKAFWKELKDAGIEVASFNPVTKYMDKLYFNFRSHQKIIVIDGEIGYTGGFNLADEYVNAVNLFGHWKDSGVRLTGRCVDGLTTTFLGMWAVSSGRTEEALERYLYSGCNEGTTFCQILSDGPENNPDNPIASGIKQMIYDAKDYLYITTPYLIIEDEIIQALVDSARSGIDVRIITPGIPDKKLTYQLTRYNYGRLLQGGVRIYEYTPGFIHAKTYLTKDYCMLGTVNLDYRSLYLHYECAVIVWNQDFSLEVASDVESVMAQSKEITYDEWLNRPLKDKVAQKILNIVSVLF